MRPACGVSLQSRRRTGYHRLVSAVERQVADEFRVELLTPYYAAPHGSRLQRPDLVQLAKDVQHRKSRAPNHIVSLLLGARSLGASFDQVCRPLRHLEAMLGAQEPVTPEQSLDELQMLETQLESLLNPVQWQVARGDHSTPTLKRMLELIDQSIEVLQKLREKVARRLYGEPQ